MDDCLKKSAKQLKQELIDAGVPSPSRYRNKSQMCEELVKRHRYTETKPSGRLFRDLGYSSTSTSQTTLPHSQRFVSDPLRSRRRERILPPLPRRVKFVDENETIESPDYSMLPLEIQEQILLNLPYKDVLNYCNTNTASANICKDEYFWKKKLQADGYPDWLLTGDNPSRRYGQLMDYGSCLTAPDVNCLKLAIDRKDESALRYMLTFDITLNCLLPVLSYALEKDRFDISRLLLPRIKDEVDKIPHIENESPLSLIQFHELERSMIIAGAAGEYDIVYYLVTQIENSNPGNLLQYLAPYGDLPMIDKIVNEFNPDSDMFSEAIDRVLRKLSETGDSAKYLPILDYLFRHHPDINDLARMEDIGEYLNPDVVRLMLRYGFNDYDTLLIYAVDYDKVDVVDLLLENVENIDKNTLNDLLGLAVDTENLPIVKRLVNYGADLNYGLVYYLTQTNAPVEIGRYLIDKGADVNQALYQALRDYRNYDIYEFISRGKQLGADLKIVHDIANRNKNSRIMLFTNIHPGQRH